MATARFLLFALLLSGFGFGLTGCASMGEKEQPQPAPVEYGEQPAVDGEAQTTGTDMDTGETGRPVGTDAAGYPMPRTIYFGYDMSEIREDDKRVLEAHARFLTSHPQTRVRLEGHADERGSREYNLALGEKRAQAARRYLGILGVLDRQMDTLSYGEEKPVDPSHNETAWQLNRRLEIIYLD